MEHSHWITNIIVLGLLVWALKGLIMERTRKVKASDQYLTQGEIQVHCKEEQGKIRGEFGDKIDHAVSLIEKDLQHGEARFKEIGTEIKNVKQQINDMHLAIITEIKRNNGGKA